MRAKAVRRLELRADNEDPGLALADPDRALVVLEIPERLARGEADAGIGRLRGGEQLGRDRFEDLQTRHNVDSGWRLDMTDESRKTFLERLPDTDPEIRAGLSLLWLDVGKSGHEGQQLSLGSRIRILTHIEAMRATREAVNTLTAALGHLTEEANESANNLIASIAGLTAESERTGQRLATWTMVLAFGTVGLALATIALVVVEAMKR